MYHALSIRFLIHCVTFKQIKMMKDDDEILRNVAANVVYQI